MEPAHAVAATPPGTHFHYSNLGYKVLGEVMRAVTGETYGSTIQRRVLDLLGLVDSVPTITSDVRPRLAVGYGPRYDDRPLVAGPAARPGDLAETDTADGCLAMTAADLASYLRMLLCRGVHNDGRVLSEKAFARLTQRVIAADGHRERTGTGTASTRR
jgi:CubicO group peptidase (beta-lactamase class C family)